jgi:hypothetical protein
MNIKKIPQQEGLKLSQQHSYLRPSRLLVGMLYPSVTTRQYKQEKQTLKVRFFKVIAAGL